MSTIPVEVKLGVRLPQGQPVNIIDKHLEPTLPPNLKTTVTDDLSIPLDYNDGRPVEPQPFQALQQRLLDQFGGLTFFPQPNEGFWTVAGITVPPHVTVVA